MRRFKDITIRNAGKVWIDPGTAFLKAHGVPEAVIAYQERKPIMFLLKSVQDGHVPPFLYMPSGNFVPKAGLALALENGTLKIAADDTKPMYICMQESMQAKPGELIPVVLSTPDIFFQVILDTDLTGVNPGDKVTLSADGLNITATKTNGVAQIVSIPGTNAGSGVTVRFY